MKYFIEHDIVYIGNGCSCCDPTGFDSYTIRCEDDSYISFEDEYGEKQPLQFYSRTEVLEHLLQLQGIEVEFVYDEVDNDY